MADQAYLILATGRPRYLAMAAACAASLRRFDGTRPVALVSDRSAADLAALGFARLFDAVHPLDPEAGPGPIAKLWLDRAAPHAETMFVDADCLLLKPDVDRWWADLAGREAAVAGDWRTEGDWYGMDIAAMCRLAGVPRLVQMNSGALYWRQGTRLFDTARGLLARLGDFTAHDHGGTGLPDEPYLALAMGALGLAPVPIRDAATNDAWMIATMNSLAVEADATSGAPRLVKRQRTVSPSIVHFTRLWPRDVYERVARELLAGAGVRDGIDFG